MKLIKLIQGAYGYRAPGSSVTELITTKSPPFEVEESEAERLIALGVLPPPTQKPISNGAPSICSARLTISAWASSRARRWACWNRSSRTG